MPCNVVEIPGVGRGFVCTSGRRQRCACGKVSTRLCDWKTPAGRKPTCDRPLCHACTHAPAPDKDLCPAHAAEWTARRVGS